MYEIEKRMGALKKRTTKMTPKERERFIAMKNAALASAIGRVNRLLGDLACLEATRTLELANSTQVKRAVVVRDPKVRALPVDARLPRYRYLLDVTDFPKSKNR